MRKCSLHNLALERGLRCDHGFIQVLIRTKDLKLCKNFGPHTAHSGEVASIYLAERRKELLNGKIGIAPELPSKKFKDVASLWFNLWVKERKFDGTLAHNEESQYKVRWTIDKVLVPTFGELNFDEIRSVQILRWRETYTDKGLSSTTPNRYQAILSSIFTHTSDWIKTERIKPAFKLPVENPCNAVEMAPTRRRERILSHYEATKLRMAFEQLKDFDGWEICKMALKSVLSMKDLKALKIGQEIDTKRTKTDVAVHIPIVHLVKLNWFGWRTRWEKARDLAGLSDVEFRDLRKTGINWANGRHAPKLISQYAGHKSLKTTEASYIIKQSEQMNPIARDLEAQVESL